MQFGKTQAQGIEAPFVSEIDQNDFAY